MPDSQDPNTAPDISVYQIPTPPPSTRIDRVEKAVSQNTWTPIPQSLLDLIDMSRGPYRLVELPENGFFAPFDDQTLNERADDLISIFGDQQWVFHTPDGENRWSHRWVYFGGIVHHAKKEWVGLILFDGQINKKRVVVNLAYNDEAARIGSRMAKNLVPLRRKLSNLQALANDR